MRPALQRAPLLAFAALVVATVVAFFLVQSLKVSTPLISGLPSPHPARINPVSGGVCDLAGHNGVVPTSFRRTSISFLLLNRADSVDVSIVTADGRAVDTIARHHRMAINERVAYTWDGRRSDGAIAPPGDYYVQVRLIHQHRTVRITNANTGGPEPITLETSPEPIRVTSARADGVAPAVIPQPRGGPVVIHFNPVGSQGPTIRIYRTDLPGAPRLVDTYAAKLRTTAFWNGTLSDGSPAPQGTYLVALSAVDHACARTTFPSSIPPAAGSTPHAGITVRYLAAQPPLTAVSPGATATVEVDSRQHGYAWALRRAGGRAVLRSGHSSSVSLAVRLPGGSGGLYVLSLRWGSHTTSVPLVAGVGSPTAGSATGSGGPSGSHRVLVVLPTLTWQGDNPVDDDGEGLPNTLTAGTPISLQRPFTDGLPSDVAGEAGLLAYLGAHGMGDSVTTDLTLIAGGASLLDRYSGVVLAGSETWLPAATGSALSTWVEQGGHVLSFGIGALQRTVTVSGSQALDPSAPHAIDMLLARPEGVQSTGGSLLLVDRNGQSLFSSRSQALSGFRSFQSFGPVQSPARLLTSAGVSASSPAVIGYALGRGAVIDVGLPGFGTVLAHNITAQGLVGRAWKLLTR